MQRPVPFGTGLCPTLGKRLRPVGASDQDIRRGPSEVLVYSYYSEEFYRLGADPGRWGTGTEPPLELKRSASSPAMFSHANQSPHWV